MGSDISDFKVFSLEMLPR